MSPLTVDGLQATQAPSAFCSSSWLGLSSTYIPIYLYMQSEDSLPTHMQNSISHPALPAAHLLLPLTLLNLTKPPQRDLHTAESSRFTIHPPHTNSGDDTRLYLAQPECKHKTSPSGKSDLKHGHGGVNMPRGPTGTQRSISLPQRSVAAGRGHWRHQ